MDTLKVCLWQLRQSLSQYSHKKFSDYLTKVHNGFYVQVGATRWQTTKLGCWLCSVWASCIIRVKRLDEVKTSNVDELECISISIDKHIWFCKFHTSIIGMSSLKLLKCLIERQSTSNGFVLEIYMQWCMRWATVSFKCRVNTWFHLLNHSKC